MTPSTHRRGRRSQRRTTRSAGSTSATRPSTGCWTDPEPPPSTGRRPPRCSTTRPRLRARLAGSAARARARCRSLDLDLRRGASLPDLDTRFERLYGYLNDDVTRRRATSASRWSWPGCRRPRAATGATSPSRRRRWSRRAWCSSRTPTGPSSPGGCGCPTGSPRTCSATTRPDAALPPDLVDVVGYRSPVAPGLGRALGARCRRRPPPRARHRHRAGASAVAALAPTGATGARRRPRAAGRDTDPGGAGRAAAREALLRGAGLVAGPVEALAECSARGRRSGSAECRVPVLLVGATTWDPSLDADARPLIAGGPRCSVHGADALLRASTSRDPAPSRPAGVGDPLRPSARRRCRARVRRPRRPRPCCNGGRSTTDDLRAGARAQNAAGLERLARRIEPRGRRGPTWCWPPAVRTRAARSSPRGPGTATGCSPTGGCAAAAVAGAGSRRSSPATPGTGKTMSAEVIAADLGPRPLHRQPRHRRRQVRRARPRRTSSGSSPRPAGSTRCCSSTRPTPIFGKRSEVRDAHDRYANIESAYLLQRMETFDGLAMLATNLRANIDEAFTRRLDAIVDFPRPDADATRLALWRPLPGAAAAGRPTTSTSGSAPAPFELAGGNIRSAAITAAYLAAADAAPVDAWRTSSPAVQQEYRKLGRLVLEQEFGRTCRDAEPADSSGARWGSRRCTGRLAVAGALPAPACDGGSLASDLGGLRHARAQVRRRGGRTAPEGRAARRSVSRPGGASRGRGPQRRPRASRAAGPAARSRQRRRSPHGGGRALARCTT